MKRYIKLTERQNDFKIGDILMVGKFKNRQAVVKGFGIDKNNQPTVITNKGTFALYKFRIQKLMP